MSIFNRKLKEKIELQEKQIETLKSELARMERIMVWAREDRPTFIFVKHWVPITNREGFAYPCTEMITMYNLHLYIDKREYTIPIDEADWKVLPLDIVKHGEIELLNTHASNAVLLTIRHPLNQSCVYRFTIDINTSRYVITEVEGEAKED